jgi:transporter family protein
MTNELRGILVGGLLPAFFYAFSAVLAKSSMNAGIGVGRYLLVIGFAVLLVGTIFCLLFPDRAFSSDGATFSFFTGVTWALASGGVAVALGSCGAPVSKLVPLYNMNTLIAVLLGLWMFSEWQQVNLWQLLSGALLIVLGGILVANA